MSIITESDIQSTISRMFRRDKEYRENLIIGLHSNGDDFLNFLETAPPELLERYSRIPHNF
jgi:hypothetical protein